MKYVLLIMLILFGKTVLAQSTLPQHTTHSVVLTWTAGVNNGDPGVGYFAYREIQGSTTYSKITTGFVVPTTYTDNDITVETTYSYYVTAVDASGVESSPSNTTTATIPNTFIPQAPILGPITGS